MSQGNLTTYVNSNPQQDRLSLVSLSLCLPSLSPQLSSVGRRREGPRLPPLSWRDPRRSEGGKCLQVPVNLPHRCSIAKHPRGCLRPCAYHRFWPRSRYLRDSFYGRRPEPTVDRTGSLSGDRNAEYRIRCFFVRNGHDRGVFQLHNCVPTSS